MGSLTVFGELGGSELRRRYQQKEMQVEEEGGQ